MRNKISSLAGCALALCVFSAYSQDYLPAPVPASFTQDTNTTFLVDLTTVKTVADYALGSNQLTLEATNFEAGEGYTGPIGVSTARNWPTNAWTIEMLVRVPYLSTVLASNNPIGLVDWVNNSVGCQFDFSLDPGFGVKSKIYSWNPGNGSFMEIPYAGGNGYSIQNSAADEWVYIALGCDFVNHLCLTSARNPAGAILNSNINFMPVPSSMTNSPAAWLAMQGYFSTGMPSTLTIGNSLVEIQAIKISNCYRSNIFNMTLVMPLASSNNWIPSTLDPTRTATQMVVRAVGFPQGYQNYIQMPVAETYLQLLPGSPPITITLTNQPLGLYSFMVYGQIAPSNRTSLNQVWNPCPLDFAAYGSSSNLLASGEMLLKQAFDPRRMQGFHVHVDVQDTVTATFSLPARATETVWIQQISLVDQLAGLPDVAVKTSQNFFTGGATNQDTILTTARMQRDDLIWSSLPPLNTPLQIEGINNSFQKPPAGIATDGWITAAFSNILTVPWYEPQHTFAPLDFLDTNTGAIFPQSQILAWPVQALPGAYPDYGWGSFFPTNGGWTGGWYYAQRAQLLGAQYLLFAGAVENPQGTQYGLDLGDNYFSNGVPDIGHDGAMALVRLAYDWPALEMNLHEVRLCTQSPDLDYSQDWSFPQHRNGKMLYTGDSGQEMPWLFNTYDQLFPYIQSNQVFAAAVHREVPWVNTPQDVIRLLDRFLVFASVMDATNGSQEIDPSGNVELLAGQELGPSSYSSNLFNLTDNVDSIYPISGTDQELYATALSRSGVYYIGSFMCYAVESAQNTIQQASLIQNAEANGIDALMNLANVTEYPKVRSAGNFLIDMWVAGGFPFMVGDASGGPHTGLQSSSVLRAAGNSLVQAFNLYGDPRHAWELKNVVGITTNSSINAAAATVTDPILYATSRVVPDYGAILEMEPGDPNTLHKTSATFRLGIGSGHAHYDYLDLNLFGMGLPLAVNVACRDEAGDWSRPSSTWSFLSNHALGHETNDPSVSGSQNGEPWLRAFAPPLVSGSYLDPSPLNGFELDRDTILMQVGTNETFYAFDVQRVTGNTYHTWCFHGCESSNLVLNVPMQSQPNNEWINRTLETAPQLVGSSTNMLQATWTMTRQAQSIPYSFDGGGTLQTVACEQTVLGALYNAALPPVNVRATLLGRGHDTVLQGDAYSAVYQYCFPFLWVQTTNEAVSTYTAIYEWYRGATPVVARAQLIQSNPLQVAVTTTSGQIDTYEFTTNYCLAISRDTNGVRWIKLSGSTQVSLPDVTISPASNYVVTIIDIDYQNRTLTTSGPLPNNPGVIAGNSGRRVFLQLSGSGTSFGWADDLLVQEGLITDLHVTGANTISIASDQALLFDGEGNRSSAAMTVSTEDGLWNFRGGTVIKQPPGTPLTADVFTDANGDGRIDMKTYEIGVGDQLSMPADITIQRISGGWSVSNNVALSGSINSSNSATFNLAPSIGWQTVTNGSIRPLPPTDLHVVGQP